MSLDHSNHTSDVEEGEINDEPVMPVKQVQSPMQVATTSSLNGKHAADNGSKAAAPTAGRFFHFFSFFFHGDDFLLTVVLSRWGQGYQSIPCIP